MIKKILLILITIFIPPLGVFLVAGCGADLFINILLTFLGYLPGHIHAFYIEYVYVKRRREIEAGVYNGVPAPGVYSKKVQNGGLRTLPVARAAHPQGGVVQGGPVGGGPVPQQGYGTVR